MQSVNAVLVLPRLGGFLIPAQWGTLAAPVAAVSGLRSGGGCGLPVPGDVGLRRDSPDSLREVCNASELGSAIVG